ncbi:MAG: phosphonate ABC transporter ATP-binding protein [Propionibacteriaceae bacterium]|nr:phosphonate ABC transporter ATP-binding protein [Propionibacteriaceae bacterium]
MTQVLSVCDLRKRYGKFEALRGVDLDFEPGKFTVIIGPSGAGKSTFIRCINRMVDPDGGEIVFDSAHMEQLRGAALRQRRAMIGMIFQHYNLVARTNVLRNVLHGRLGYMPLWKSLLGAYPESEKRRALDLLDEVGLSDQMYKRADTLSGGQMQRVGICRALMQAPKLLLADEPIASLDPKSAEVVMEHLKQTTKQRGLCCIVNLHQVEFARKYADRIIGLKAGRVVFEGSPATLSDAVARDIYENAESRLENQLTGADIARIEDEERVALCETVAA